MGSFRALVRGMEDGQVSIVELAAGSTTFGRGFMGVSDLHVSRNHLRAEFDDVKGIITLTQLGANPSVVQRENEDVVILWKSTSHIVESRVEFSLLRSLPRWHLEVLGRDEGTSEKLAGVSGNMLIPEPRTARVDKDVFEDSSDSRKRGRPEGSSAGTERTSKMKKGEKFVGSLKDLVVKGDSRAVGELLGAGGRTCVAEDRTVHHSVENEILDDSHRLLLIDGLVENAKKEQDALGGKMGGFQFSIAFPPISVGNYGFPADFVAETGVPIIDCFLKEYSDADIRIFLVHDHEGPELDAFRRVRDQMDTDSRFRVDCAELWALREPCRFIVNVCDWRFSPRTGGVNLALHQVAGEGVLQRATRDACSKGTIEVGEAVSVELPADCPLRREGGVQFVIQVAGPNVNPLRAHCIDISNPDGLLKAKALLAKSFQSALDVFASFSGLRGMSALGDPIFADPIPESRCFFEEMVRNRARFRSEFHFEDDDLFVIRDRYPKAKFHFLVICKQLIPSPSSLSSSDLPLLRKMVFRARLVARECIASDSTSRFRIGFHAIPSMRQLHLHVVSLDFSSEFLKTRVHWLSFTTEFFLVAEDALNQLKERGRINIDRKRYACLLTGSLCCHRLGCGRSFSTIGDLKEHLEDCDNDLPES